MSTPEFLSGQYEPGKTGICPQCGRETRFVNCLTPAFILVEGSQPQQFAMTRIFTSQQSIAVRASQCFLCEKIIAWVDGNETPFRFWPVGAERPVPEEVPPSIAAIYVRASRQHDYDNVASAAFARTCLEKLLDDVGVPSYPKLRNLKDRIQCFLDSDEFPDLSTELTKNVEVLRDMGNFIHLNESYATGEIVEIASEEALWALDILDGLFREIYVVPQEEQARRLSFEKKLDETKGNSALPQPKA